MTSFAGARVLVAGAGVSGRSAAALLARLGAEVTVTDSDPARLAALPAGVRAHAGLDRPPEGTQLVVTSPGWRPASPLLRATAGRGIELIGDVELAWRVGCAQPRPPAWLAVTGTNGKTTTVGMLESILLAAGAGAVACGNIGLPVTDAVTAGHEVLAVELSSFQLHWSATVRPVASAVLNVAEDHLDWHGSIDAYAAAKGRIYAGAATAVYNADDAWSSRLAAGQPHTVGFTLGEPGPGRLGVAAGELVDSAFGSGTVLAAVADVRPAGPHNVANALAAAALARGYGVSAGAVATGLRDYRPGGHRAQRIADIGGVGYIDDSKATNPHATAASLRAHHRVVWLAGGQLKGASVDALVAAAADRLAGVVLLGADRDVIAAAVRRHAPDVPLVSLATGDDGAMAVMDRAVGEAARLARPGDVVLLAPAAASLDMFTDYAERGEAFAAAVRRLAVTTAGTPR